MGLSTPARSIILIQAVAREMPKAKKKKDAIGLEGKLQAGVPADKKADTSTYELRSFPPASIGALQRAIMIKDALAIVEELPRLNQLVAILPHLEQSDLIRLMNDSAHRIVSLLRKAYLFTSISKFCSKETIDILISHIDFFPEEHIRAETYGSIAQYATQDQVSFMYNNAKNFSDNTGFSVGIGRLCLYLSEKERYEVADMALSIDDINARRFLTNQLAKVREVNLRDIYEYPTQKPQLVRQKEEGNVPDAVRSPVHPGTLIGPYLDEKGWSVSNAARQLGVTREHLYHVLRGGSDISTEMAKALSRNKMGGTPLEWLMLQAEYNLTKPDRPKTKRREPTVAPET